jgi:hypothetical protein
VNPPGASLSGTTITRTPELVSCPDPEMTVGKLMKLLPGI